MDDSREILIALGRLEGKVESLIQLQKSQSEALNDLDVRVRNLEQSRSALLGAAGIIGALAGTVISWLFKEI